MARDLYETLGVPRGATADEIKKAYRKLARQAPPRRQRRRQEVRGALQGGPDAYDVLSDDEKRKQYDMFGAGGPQMGAGRARRHPLRAVRPR